jgi:hypothetical protein
LILGFALAMSVGVSSVSLAQTPAGALATAPQGAAQQVDSVYSAAELDKLVAPVALYPDALLAQALPASAYPIDIVQGARWLDKNKAAVAKQDFSAVDALSLDPSVKALMRFPDVIKRMNGDLDWTTDLGDAFVNQPKDVADAIQRMRAKAEATGALKTSPQQKVVKQKEASRDVIIIESGSPDVIYVPVYDSVQVYDPTAGIVAASLLTFGTAVAIGSVWNNNYWNWGSGVVYPPRWPGYPGYRPGWNGNNNINIGNDINIGNNVNVGNRPGWNGNNNINIGNDIKLGNNVNVGNNVRPWRPDADRYRPGQGSKPGLRPENRPGQRPAERPATTGGADRPAQGLGQGADRPGQGAGQRPGAQRPGQGASQRPGGDRPNVGQRPETRPAPRPEPRPAARPSPAKPGGAFGGVEAGRGPAQAFSNRGVQSINRAPAMAGRPAAAGRPMGGGGGRGGMGGGGGGRGGRR